MSYRHPTGSVLLAEQVESGMKTLIESAKFVLIIAFLLGAAETTAGWRPYRIHNYNLTAYSLSDKAAVNGSIINLEGISLFVDIKKELVRPFIRFEIYVDSGDGLIDLKYVNETVDLCRFFRNKKYLPFMQIIYRTFVDQGNYPTSCPITKVVGKLYFLCAGSKFVDKSATIPLTYPTSSTTK